MTDRLILDGSDHTVTVAGGNDFNIVGTSASEKIVVQDGALVQFAAGTGDRVEVAGSLSSFSVSSAGNQLILSDAEGSDIIIALNAQMTMVFSDGSATATMDTSGSLPAVTLGNEVVDDDFDYTNVVLNESGTSLYPGTEEQLMLEILNAERAAPDEYASQYGIDLNEGLEAGTISSDPKQPLAFNTLLAEAARGHSQWMLENDIFSHTGSGGSNPGDRIEAEGYEAYGWGENLAWRGTWPSAPDTAESTAQLEENLFVDEGYPERGHRTNMLNEAWTEVGIGIETGIFTVDGQDYNAVMAAQDFGIPAGQDNFLVGVVFSDNDADMFYDVDEGLSDVQVTVTSRDSGESLDFSTWDSGGYQAALEDGVYDVVFNWEGKTFDTEVTMSGINEKVDWILQV